MICENNLLKTEKTVSVEDYVATLASPVAEEWFDKLVVMLQRIAEKDNLSREECALVHHLFTLIPRGNGDRDKIFYLLDHLAGR